MLEAPIVLIEVETGWMVGAYRAVDVAARNAVHQSEARRGDRLLSIARHMDALMKCDER